MNAIIALLPVGQRQHSKWELLREKVKSFPQASHPVMTKTGDMQQGYVVHYQGGHHSIQIDIYGFKYVQGPLWMLAATGVVTNSVLSSKGQADSALAGSTCEALGTFYLEMQFGRWYPGALSLYGIYSPIRALRTWMYTNFAVECN